MYLIVSAFRSGITGRENAASTAALILAVELAIENDNKEIRDMDLVTGVYKGDREVSVRLWLHDGLSQAAALALAGRMCGVMRQECVAIVDSGTLVLVDEHCNITATGDLESTGWRDGVPQGVDAWTASTGPDSINIFTRSLRSRV